ncbi:CMRF35-like molecule 9 isoform X6 [Ursus arctos]|uniref:CMRF35-like molecule 9 isoform X6 n=1 Tax=Ursus arctos TaxID=9644 RepID=UPI001CF91723|nr:CMRF35-like molecule 9 isoform X6 [Ursus arctos]
MWPLVLLWGCLLLPGYAAMVGPKEISGFEGDTVSLQCTYKEELRTRQKYWCRESGLILSRCSGTVYAREDGEETMEGRVSIRDSPQTLTLHVTLRKLTLKDTGKYFCGVSKLGLDDSFLVSLLVFPDGGSRLQRGNDLPEVSWQEVMQPGFKSRSLLSSFPHSLLPASYYKEPPAQGKSLANSAPSIKDLPPIHTAGHHLREGHPAVPQQQQLRVQGLHPNDPHLGPGPGAAGPPPGRRPDCPRQLSAPLEEGSSTGRKDTEEREGPPLTLAAGVHGDQARRAPWASRQPQPLHRNPVPQPDFRGK